MKLQVLAPPAGLAAVVSSLVLGLISACASPDYGRPLPPGAPALLPLKKNEKPPDFAADVSLREDLLPALDRSIEWTRKDSSRKHFPIEGVSYERALASLERFRELLLESPTHKEFLAGLAREFQVYKSAGWNAKGGGVLFTGYCTPILDGSLEPGPGYDYPLYGLPGDLVKGPEGEILGQQTAAGISPYPTREAIEAGGLLANQGLELAWLRNPMDAYIAHVNGSAFVRLEGGTLHKLGYSGKNGQPYTSLGQELVRAKEIKAADLSLSALRNWAAANPGKIQSYMNRNESYVFFLPIEGTPRGSLNVEVAAERSLATDKRLFPRGALVFVDCKAPGAKKKSKERFKKFMLDQDTGGAIRTAGRGDIYLGIGPEAEKRAGSTRSEGQLYYLFLKPDVAERLAAERGVQAVSP